MQAQLICWLTSHCGLLNIGGCIGVKLEFKLEADGDGVSSTESSSE